MTKVSVKAKTNIAKNANNKKSSFSLIGKAKNKMKNVARVKKMWL